MIIALRQVSFLDLPYRLRRRAPGMSTLGTKTWPSPSDEELIEQVRRADTRAAGDLIARYRDAMVRMCLAYLGNVHDAEDAAHDVLARVSPDHPLPQGRFRPWLYKVARNHCLNLRKKRKDGRAGAGSFLGDSRWPSPRTGPGTAFLRDEAREHIQRLMAEMPEHHRELLILRYFEGLRRAEIAQIVDLSESLVSSRLFEATRKLKEQLRETGDWP